MITKRLSLFFTMLFCAAVFADDLPIVAVYVTGDMSDNEKRVLGTYILTSFINDGRYAGLEDPAAFLADIAKSGAVNDSIISKSGLEADVDYVCIVSVTPAFGFFSVAARLVDVETGEVVFSGEATSPLRTMDDLTQVSNRVVRNMIGVQAPIAPPPKPVSPPASVAYAQTPPAASASVPVSSAPVVPARPPVAVAPPAPTPAAPQTAWPPKAAVYITGLNPLLGNALSKAVSSALMKANIYKGIESIDQHITGAPNDGQIIQAGKKAGVHFVFVVNVSGQINVRILDVDLATEMAKVSLDGKMSSPIDAGRVAVSIVNFILKSGPKPPPGYTPPVKAPAAPAGRTTADVMNDGRSRFDAPPPGPAAPMEKQRPKHSLGTLWGFDGSIEYHTRAGINENCRYYGAIGVWGGNNGYYVTDQYGNRFINPNYYKGREVHIVNFIEWNTNASVFNIFGGPGVMLGFYSYDGGYSSVYNNVYGDGVGFVVAVQGGMELRLGWLLIGADTRFAYYMRSNHLDNRGKGTFGIRTAITF